MATPPTLIESYLRQIKQKNRGTSSMLSPENQELVLLVAIVMRLDALVETLDKRLTQIAESMKGSHE